MITKYMRTPEKLYEFHVKNLRAIDNAIECVSRPFRIAISQGEEDTIFTFVRLYAFLVGAWAECRLRKLIYEPRSFTEHERNIIRSKDAQLDKWLAAVELAFRSQYGVHRAELSEDTLSHATYSRFTTLQSMLDQDLRSIIGLRNKLAHGQWAYPLNSDENDIAQEQMDALRTENLLSLQFKRSLISYLSDAIHDLIVSRPTFERDFDEHYRAIVNTRRNLRTRDYTKYVSQLQDKYERGKVRRNP